MEWKEVRLGDIAEVNIGRTPPRKEYQWFNNPQRAYKWVSIKDMGACGKYIYDTSETITQEGQKKFNIPIVPPRTILLSFKLTVGRLAITGDEEMLTNEAIAQLPIINDQIIDKDYLYYYLKSFRYESLGNTSSIATAVNSKTIKELPVLYPPLATQRRISSILSSLDRKIELNNKINATLEELAQTLFKSWFVDFEPFKNGKFIETEIGEIPAGWRVAKAEDVYKINIGKTPPRKEHQWFSKDSTNNVWVSIADMGNCGAFISDSSEYLTNEAVSKHNIIMVDEGTVLLSFKLTIGRVAIAATRLTTNEAIARFVLPNASHLEFLYLCLKQYNYAALGSTSSIATAVNSKTIKAMPLLIPSDRALQEFSTIVAPMFERIKKLSQETLTLTHLRDTLLPRLMSGEIEV